MKTQKIARYYNMKKRFDLGYLSDEDWIAYCMVVLKDIMEENKDVLVRLKERG